MVNNFNQKTENYNVGIKLGVSKAITGPIREMKPPTLYPLPNIQGVLNFLSL